MKQLFFTLLLFTSLGLSGQSIGSYNISPAGSSSMSENGGLYFAIGEPINTEIGSGDLIISQGFLQVAIQGGINDTYELLIATAKIFPNPVSHSLNLELQDAEGVHQYSLLDVTGKKLASGELINKSTTIDFESHSSGTYFLQVFTDKEFVGVYTIIKQ